MACPQGSAGEFKKTSNMSIQSGKSNYIDSYSEIIDDRKSSAGRKTIADLVRIDPNKQQVNKRRAVIAPPVPVDTSDLQYEKFAKDER